MQYVSPCTLHYRRGENVAQTALVTDAHGVVAEVDYMASLEGGDDKRCTGRRLPLLRHRC
jgi:hypothetical protein